MRVLFVVNRLDFADHIAISYLSAIARQQGHATFFCQLDTSRLAEAVDRVGPDVVAYSANVMGFQHMVAEHRQARRRREFVSIMGGPQATFSPETFAESGMDAYCVGEGEYAFRDFLARVEAGTAFDDVDNLITGAGANPVRPLIRNLDELPPADRDLVLANSFLKDTPKKTFYATRGCPFECAYCCNNYYHALYRGKGPTVRRFSVQHLLGEIERVKAGYRMEFVKFGDDLFAARADAWLEEFAEEYPRRVGVPFNCFLRLDIVDERLLALLKRAGCYSVHLSVDSTSAHVRERVLKRRMKKVDVAQKLRLIRDHGINTWVNYMLAAPESTLQDDLDTIRLSREGKVTYPSYSTTVPMKGTDLYDYCVRLGYVDAANHSGDMSGCTRRSTLACFDEREKDIRYNIFLLGAVLAKLPRPLETIGLHLCRTVPPNPLFATLRERVYQYYIMNKIFRLSDVA